MRIAWQAQHGELGALVAPCPKRVGQLSLYGVRLVRAPPRLLTADPLLRRVPSAKSVERHTCEQGCTCFPYADEGDYAARAGEACSACGGPRFSAIRLSAGGSKLVPKKVRRAGLACTPHRRACAGKC